MRGRGSCRTSENVRPQDFTRDASKPFEAGDMIHRNLGPLRSRASAQTERLGHGDDAAEFLGGFENDRVSFAHDATYSTAKHRPSSAAIPRPGLVVGQLGMQIGSAMRKARDRAKRTQQQVADELGVTKGAVSQWENDLTVPELEYFVAFCVYTNASADELLLHRDMDQLLKQLIEIWKDLTPDGRDSVLGNANRVLARERPEGGRHNPFPAFPQPRLNSPKQVKRGRSA